MVEYVVDFVTAQRKAHSRTQDDGTAKADKNLTKPCVSVDRVFLLDENTGLAAQLGRIRHFIADVPQMQSTIELDLRTHLISGVQPEDDDG